jgi:hypothetical protein
LGKRLPKIHRELSSSNEKFTPALWSRWFGSRRGVARQLMARGSNAKPPRLIRGSVVNERDTSARLPTVGAGELRWPAWLSTGWGGASARSNRRKLKRFNISRRSPWVGAFVIRFFLAARQGHL